MVLIPRLRRFGKTLNLSMLRYFFEKGKEDTAGLFKHLKIWKNEKYQAMQGQFPVIFITLKDVKQSSWEETFQVLKELVAEEFERHSYLLEGETLTEREKIQYNKILFQECEKTLLEKSLFFLSKCLCRYHKRQVVLLIDEYDTPAHAAFIGKYYDTLIGFLRNWLSAGLKDNMYLEKGVLTGILRIAKESIFSGLHPNNLKNWEFDKEVPQISHQDRATVFIDTMRGPDGKSEEKPTQSKTNFSSCLGVNNISTFTILNETFSDKFGLLESEVEELLDDYGLSEKLDSIRQWYNGYRIGSSTNIYNPWSVLNCIANNGSLAPYWVNTSENALMKQLIAQGKDDLKADVEELMEGRVIEKTIEEGVVFSDLEKKSATVWALLLFSGYLTIDAPAVYGTPCLLRIPNLEIEELYKSMILEWFAITIQATKYQELLNSLVNGDVDTFSQIFREFLLSSVSVFDVAEGESEKIYHAFVLGMLIGLKNQYEVKSNRESGYGRYDVILIPKNLQDLGLV